MKRFITQLTPTAARLLAAHGGILEAVSRNTWAVKIHADLPPGITVTSVPWIDMTGPRILRLRGATEPPAPFEEPANLNAFTCTFRPSG